MPVSPFTQISPELVPSITSGSTSPVASTLTRAVNRSEPLSSTAHASFVPSFETEIAPRLAHGQRVLVSAHGNSLRALVKHLSKIGDEEIVGLEIPTGEPIVYELEKDLSVGERYYLSERAA